jgi:hypothetical protein
MLYIVRKGDKGTASWHVNEPAPDNGSTWEDVCEIQADGHELDYIRRHLIGLPDKPNGAFLTWKGMLAQFIYDNCLQNPKKYEY